MAISVNYPATDSSSSVTKAISVPSLTFATDWAVEATKNGSTNLTNLTVPLGLSELATINVQDIADIYSSSRLAIERAQFSPTRKGRTVYHRLDSCIYLTDSADATWRQVIPISVAISCKFGVSPYVTSTVIATMIARAVGLLYETADTTMYNHIDRVARGATTPADL